MTTLTGTNFATSAKRLNSQLDAAIGQGYLATCVGPYGGTDKLLGREPKSVDISQNPAFPFILL